VTDPITVRRALETSGLVAVDARVLLGHVLGKDRAWLAAHATETIPAAQADEFFALAKRRRDGEPVAYLTGTREFWGLAIAVSPAVLIPRPETETLVEMALAWLPADRETRVLDLGTGSGAIALAIAHERPRTLVLATDISDAALSLARDNARRLQIANIEFARSDWFAALPSKFQGTRFDLIVSNPPYVEAGDAHLSTGDLQHEPAVALSPGDDGLLAIRRIVAGAPEHLVAGGALIVEHGYDQEDAVRALFTEAGFTDVTSARDLAGIPRVVGGRGYLRHAT
jgi:release factor glutamine methyltransferase